MIYGIKKIIVKMEYRSPMSRRRSSSMPAILAYIAQGESCQPKSPIFLTQASTYGYGMLTLGRFTRSMSANA